MCACETQYTYNEEYEYTVPELPVETELYVFTSDSEDDSVHFNYQEELSSSESSGEDDEDYFRKFRRSVTPEFLDCNRNDDEEDLIIPLETEDCDFGKVDLDEKGQMICPVCSIIFKSKIRFVIHKRRHFAMDHFACPVCFKGFLKLHQCQAHEYQEHQQNQHNEDSDGPKYSFRTRNARKTTNFNEEVDILDDDLICIVPSTCLYPYQGPDISNPYQPYHIEVKYGRSERKSHSKIQSKYTLECQRRNKAWVTSKVAEEETRIKLQKEARDLRGNRRLGRIIGDGDETGFSDGDLDYSVPNPVAHSSRRRQPIKFQSQPTGPTCYFCSLCGFTSIDEQGIHFHQDESHPEVPVSELIHFLQIDRSLRSKKQKIDPPSDEEYSGRKGRGKRKVEKLSRHEAARAKRRRRIEKKKEAKLFRKRKHIPRIWEKITGQPTKDEFIFAVGLIRKSDVLLGTRKTQALISSSLFRKRRREVSPVPMVRKSIRIPLKRMSPSKHKRFFVCQHCEYYAESKVDVRRHRRSVHLRTLRQSIDSNEGETKSKESNSSKNKKKKEKVKKKDRHNLTSELHVHLEDISLSMNVKPEAGSISSPPRKKTKVS